MFGLNLFFESYESKAVRTELTKLISQHAELSHDVLTEACTRLLRENRKVIRKLVCAERIPASRCATFLVLNSCADLVASGAHHSYRGVLTVVGRDLLAVHSRLLGHMVYIGMMAGEDAEQARAGLREAVAEAG